MSSARQTQRSKSNRFPQQPTANKSDQVRSFRIEDLQASGSAGEKPPVNPSTVRVKPDSPKLNKGLPSSLE